MVSPPDPRVRRRHWVALSAAAFLLGLALTALGVLWLVRDGQADARIRFERHTNRLQSNIEGRFEKAMYGFKGLRSHYIADHYLVGREAFRAWVMSRNVQDDFPGIRGLGFIQRVPRDNLERFLASERADAAPDFAVSTSGDAPDLYVIKFIEPLSNNRKAWGYDIGSEPVRRAAAERAVRTGQPALTGRIALVQDGKQRPGFLFLLPVFRSGMPTDTPRERQAALVGLIYAPIVVEEFLAGVNDMAVGQLDYELFDGSEASNSTLIFDLDGHYGPVRGPGFSSAASGTNDAGSDKPVERHPSFFNTRTLAIGGRELSLRVSSTTQFDSEGNDHSPLWLGLAGTLLSGLLASTVWLLGSGRARAEALAQGMTADLNAAKTSAETALRDSHTLLDTLNQHTLMSVTDRAGTIIEVNEAFCLLSGYSRDELIGHNHRIINSGVHDADFWRRMWKTISRGQPWSAEVCNRAKDGSLYWVQSIVTPLVGADGRVERYISIRTDITHNKRAQQELKDMAERFTLAIEGGNDGLWDWFDVRAHKEWWSPQFYRLLGYEPGEIPADLVTFDTLLHPDHQASTFLAIERAFKGLEPFDVEYMLRTKSGAYRWFRARAKVFHDEAGQASRMAGSIQDIHERRIAQEQLKVHSEQLDAIFSLSPDGFVSFDAQRRVSYASTAFTRLTGLPAGGVAGQDEGAFLSLLLARTLDSRPVQDFAELHERCCGLVPAPARGRRATGLVIEMTTPVRRLLALRMHQGTGSAVSQVLHLRDVTHETELDQMKSAFLSMAAHELRTPMASIYGFTELLMTRDMPQPKRQDLLGRIYRQSEVMISIINELLDLSRIEARQGKDFELEACDLVDLVTDAVHDYQPPDGRAAPALRLPDRPLSVLVDRQKMQQGVLNILSNAYKYSPQGGEVVVDFTVQDMRGVPLHHGVRVTDHGIGMTPEQLMHMGERFYRADKSGNIPGTGLGVSIVKETLELMGGDMLVDSTPGEGTRVTLWLPAWSPEHALADVTATQEG